ncbi:hypothetical protein ACFX2C_006762 [Malus domestica]
MSRLPFHDRTEYCNFSFQKVHTNLWGPSPIAFIEGYKYYVSFVDEFTRFVWIFPLIHKSEVFDVFQKFYNFGFTQFNIGIKCLQTDGGDEYISRRFDDFLKHKGIVHMISCPYTPQQNGLAERKHRHIVETAITLMTTTQLPHDLWYHACAHYIFLINRMPCKVLGMQSPYQRLYGVSPQLQGLKVFGTAVYPYIRPYTVNKLQPRASLCVFMGYALGYKGVICFHPKSRKFIISRHVIHDEDLFPYKSLHTLHNTSQGLSYQDSTYVSSPIHSAIFLPQSVSVPNDVSSLEFVEGQSSIDLSSSTTMNTSLQSSGTLSHSSIVLESETTPSSSSSTTLMLLVFDPAQVEVILPLPSSSNSGTTHHIVSFPSRMQTRLQTGAISKKTYANYIASLPELQSLQLDFQDSCYIGFLFVASVNDISEPKSFRSAATNVNWKNAMQEEFDALKSQRTWVLVPPPTHRSIIGSKWVYKLKKNPDGSISRYKARLVAQGYTQELGLNYFETFSPIVRHTTVRLIISIAAQNKWELRQLDIKSAFLHGDLEEEVYMKQPQGFVDSTHPDFV